MKEQILEIIRDAAPLVAGFITSTLLPALISKWSVGRLRRRIDTVKATDTERDIINRLDRIENELLELRGKRK